MNPDQQIITRIPVKELLDWQGHPMRRVRSLSLIGLKELMRGGPIPLCVAEVGLPLSWVSDASFFSFIKQEVLPRLVDPNAAIDGFFLDTYPGGYAYLASSWEDALGNDAILLEKCH